MIEEKKKYTYDTKSLEEFATLLCLGASLVKVDRETDERFYKFFLESDTVDMEKAILELASDTLMVSAHKFYDALRRAKSIVHTK